MSWIIALGSQVWSRVNQVRRGLHKPGSGIRFPGRVVSVGNIQAGGSGKTPVVVEIARESIARGLKVAILSRGYHSEWEKLGGQLIPGDPKVAARICGDEPALMRDELPEAFFGIGGDRIAAFEKLREKARTDFDLIILDDGFQNLSIAKDLEIVLATAKRPDQILFREFPDALAQADLVIWTKGTRPDIEVGKPKVEVLFKLPLGAGGPIHLVAGVADPQSVLGSAREAGYLVKRLVERPDHAQYQRAEVESFLAAASRDGCQLACTGKDWVKWRDLGISAEQVLRLEPRLEFIGGKEIWTRSLWGE